MIVYLTPDQHRKARRRRRNGIEIEDEGRKVTDSQTTELRKMREVRKIGEGILPPYGMRTKRRG